MDFIEKHNVRAEAKWLSVLNNQTGKNGSGQNKLRTQYMFKSSYKVEYYVSINVAK